MKLDPNGLSLAADAFLAANGANKTVGYKELSAAITAYLAASQEPAPVGYVTPDAISEVAAGRIGNHLFPKGTLRPENEIPVYASLPQEEAMRRLTEAQIQALSCLAKHPYGRTTIYEPHLCAALRGLVFHTPPLLSDVHEAPFGGVRASITKAGRLALTDEKW